MFDLQDEMRLRHDDGLRRAARQRLIHEARRAQPKRQPRIRVVISRLSVGLCRFANWFGQNFGVQEAPFRSAS